MRARARDIAMSCGTCDTPRAVPPRLARRGAPVLSRPQATSQAPSQEQGIIAALNALAGLLAPTDSYIISFSRSIPAATANAEAQRIPFDANIVAAFIHFPPGVHQLVDVRLTAIVGDALRYIVPSKQDSYIALDDSFIPFLGLKLFLPSGSTLQAEWYNYDGANAHTVPLTVVVAVVGRSGGVALPESIFIPAQIRDLTPPTIAPEPPAVRAPVFKLPEFITPILPPLVPVLPVSPEQLAEWTRLEKAGRDVKPALSVSAEVPALTLKRPVVSPSEVAPGDTISVTIPIEVKKAPLLGIRDANIVLLDTRSNIILAQSSISLASGIGASSTRPVSLFIPNDASLGEYALGIREGEKYLALFGGAVFVRLSRVNSEVAALKTKAERELADIEAKAADVQRRLEDARAKGEEDAARRAREALDKLEAEAQAIIDKANITARGLFDKARADTPVWKWPDFTNPVLATPGALQLGDLDVSFILGKHPTDPSRVTLDITYKNLTDKSSTVNTLDGITNASGEFVGGLTWMSRPSQTRSSLAIGPRGEAFRTIISFPRSEIQNLGYQLYVWDPKSFRDGDPSTYLIKTWRRFSSFQLA